MPKTAHYSPFTTHRPGARLYHSTASVWLSVDPLSDKYPNLSPYTYCANNPVRLVDPDGRDIWTIYEDGTIDRQRNNKIDRIDVVSSSGTVIHGTETKYGNIKQHTISKIDYSSFASSQFVLKMSKISKKNVA